jgi:hypothetical protein
MPTKYALWGYDKFPFFLMSPTDGRKEKDGTVSVPAYGHNARVEPVVLLSEKEGGRVKAEIDAIKADYSTAKAALFEGFKARTLTVHPKLTKFF